jgi:hypothetical protein
MEEDENGELLTQLRQAAAGKADETALFRVSAGV